VAATPTRRVSHGEVVELAGREWHAVHTPGHTLDHLCLFDPAMGFLLAGDHVLPTITPHIAGEGSGRDPLKMFFASLDRVAELPGLKRALPAHGHPFDDVPGRVQAIKKHHEERIVVLRRAMEALGPASVETLSHELFRKDHWGAMAESETYAHLEHLRLLGVAERSERAGLAHYELDRAAHL
jgi:glyoxylase-like metal-dependent hydrolase (beta-lactamase superfamily II)